MLLELPSDQRVWFIGDPHLGRRFENGVPLHRRGEREKRQFERFTNELLYVGVDMNIMVGDLFDHPQVSMQTILDAAEAYLHAADKRPSTDFFAMAGNHDRSRQLGSVGAWEVFKRLVEGRRKNLFVVDYAGQVETIAFFPWEWGKTVTEQFGQADIDWSEIELVVGHWDLESYGGSDDHLAPTKLFPKGVQLVTGHYHLPGDYVVDGVSVVCTGSLEPYTHAEDPNGEIYVTLTLEQLQECDPAELREKSVRVLLHEGDELPELDCLQLTGKRIIALEDDETTIAQRVGAFDWQAILDQHLADVPDYVRSFIDERLH